MSLLDLTYANQQHPSTVARRKKKKKRIKIEKNETFSNELNDSNITKKISENLDKLLSDINTSQNGKSDAEKKSSSNNQLPNGSIKSSPNSRITSK